ncbi:MAG TPA: AgmX/PglI C-terminal domain-containing protein [Anaeromyxobacteraceae bacterium]|nr:AgmX/PglI C-terminal domain-containing protein [Anaeromyxobacteraceae bacterium]
MRFSCDKCGKTYVAADSVRGRAFKMKCKRCGHVIFVKPSAVLDLRLGAADSGPSPQAATARLPAPPPAPPPRSARELVVVAPPLPPPPVPQPEPRNLAAGGASPSSSSAAGAPPNEPSPGVGSMLREERPPVPDRISLPPLPERPPFDPFITGSLQLDNSASRMKDALLLPSSASSVDPLPKNPAPTEMSPKGVLPLIAQGPRDEVVAASGPGGKSSVAKSSPATEEVPTRTVAGQARSRKKASPLSMGVLGVVLLAASICALALLSGNDHAAGVPAEADPAGPVRAAPTRKSMEASAAVTASRQSPRLAESVPGQPRRAQLAVDPSGREQARTGARTRAELSSLDDAKIDATLARYEKNLEDCFAIAVDAEASMLQGGAVGVTMTVSSSGKVLNPSLDNAALNDSDMGNCIKRESGKMQFPTFGGGPVVVHRSIKFK